jgi:hypothetical protein
MIKSAQEQIAMANANEEPDVHTLNDWIQQGGCEALDGCWIEPDGHCEHGYPSWLIYMDLI